MALNPPFVLFFMQYSLNKYIIILEKKILVIVFTGSNSVVMIIATVKIYFTTGWF